jgi:hypothetical protein
MAQHRHSFPMVNPRTGKKEGLLTIIAASAKKAEQKARKFARDHGIGFQSSNPRAKRNVEMGFWTGRGRNRTFHPIRASSDYDPSRVGEGRRSRSRKRRHR